MLAMFVQLCTCFGKKLAVEPGAALTRQSRIAPRSRNSSHRVLQMPHPKLQLSSTKLQLAVDLMPESRLPARSIDMSFIFEIMSKEEREIRQILAKGERRKEFLHLLVMLLKKEGRFYRACLAESKALGSQDCWLPSVTESTFLQVDARRLPMLSSQKGGKSCVSRVCAACVPR